MNFDLTPEQRMWQAAVHEFVRRDVKPAARQTDEQAQFNHDAVRKMGPLGLLGLNIPEEYGGSGVDAVSAAIAIEELGWGCGSTALSIAAHNGLGCAPIALFGDPQQKQRWLPFLASGAGGLAALALTEPGAGSDLKGGVATRAVRRGDDWVLNGAKMWCTNAGLAQVIVVLARTGAGRGSHDLSMFLVPAHTPGLHIGPPENKMGLKGSPTHALGLQDVRLPPESLLGVEGHGLAQTLQVLDGGRIGIGALSIGLAQAAFEEAARYAKERQAFGQPIAAFQAIQWMLADAAAGLQSARLMVRCAAWLKDQGRPFSQQAAMAKLQATEMAERVCRDAIQVHGGYGYSREYPLERIYRDARLMTIGEGTSEVQRLVIARHVLQD